jgi:phosphate transport system substrate-binding protein
MQIETALRLAIVSGLALALVPFTAAPRQAQAEPISVQGSTTFSSQILEPYRAEIERLSGHHLDVIASKSIHGLVALLEGRTRLAMISTGLAGERNLLQKTRPELGADRLVEHTVSSTRIAFVVHPTNPVRTIDLDRLAAVLKGEIASWQSLGGPDMPIVVVTVQPGGGVPTTVRTQLLAGAQLSPARKIVVEAPRHVVTITGQLAGALGIAQLGLVAPPVREIETATVVEQQLNLVTLGEPDAALVAIIEATRRVAADKLD